MLHSIPSHRHGPLGDAMAGAVSRCVHCGFCLAACPTYRELGQEMDSPRGRIVLMKEVLEGALPWEAAQVHVDRCLGCLACEPACPSGVPYRDLLSPFRSLAASRLRRSFAGTLRHWLVGQTLPHPARFRVAVRLGQWAKRLRLPVPRMLRPMLDLIPDALPDAAVWAGSVPAFGTRRARVALLSGCAQEVLSPDIQSATIAVLTRQGVEVVIPSGQGCCGGLSWHTGDLAAAREFALQNLDAFPSDVDAVISNAAGCGSALHEYPMMLRGTPDAARAEAFSRQVMDVSAFLAALGWRGGFRELRLRAAYHDACHLANAQGVRQQPRDLLRAIPGLELLEIPEADQCCGSAGTYNLDQPDTAAALGRRKAQSVLSTGAEAVVSGNIGCLTQLALHLRAQGSALPLRHTVQVLRDALPDSPPS
ncbi:MAG: 4Fe-4S dicluster domain-containing protein [Verrucomicrobia bacterium]|nr:4Fe-4S dicluster domain-containing protein [Verrucomicrobiota bacterium]